MQHEQHRVPVTALGLLNRDVLLAGEGNRLNAYHVCKQVLLCSLPVFEDQQIHGIVAENDQQDAYAIVWGRQSLCRVIVKQDSDGSVSFHPGRLRQTSDWIFAIALAPFSGGQVARAAILTAHNALAIWDPADGEGEERLDPLVPGSNCILYSAHVKWLSASKCLIAAGTAFGDVILWSCSLALDEARIRGEPRTHYTFSAHEGSVFGVQISSQEVALALGGRRHLLASCSDDRTIKLWDISDLSTASPTITDMQRETGFGTRQIEEKYAPSCLSKVMAHASRIWHVRFIQDQVSHQSGIPTECDINQTRLLSFGEDASYIIWRFEIKHERNDAASYQLKQCHSQRAHRGKNIWSLAIGGTNDIFTAGADGAIIKSSVSFCPGSHQNQSEIVLGLTRVEQSRDRIKAYVFTGPDELVATTEHGRIRWWKLDAAQELVLNEISESIEGLRAYSIINSILGVAFIAGVDGAVYMCLSGTAPVTQILQTTRKVTGIHTAVLHKELENHKTITLLVTNINPSVAILSTLILEPGQNEASDRPIIESQEVHLPPDFVPASFVCWVSARGVYAALGSRTGSIAIYEIAKQCQEPIPYSSLFHGVHGKEAITALHFTKQSNSNDVSGILLSTGRDGTYAAHCITMLESKSRLETVHQLSLPFGPNIEGLGFSSSNHIWIWGFRSTRFVVYDINTEREVLVVECGGAHRNWAFQTHGEGGTFVWTKGAKLFYECKNGPSVVTIKPSGHGRDIKTVALSSSSPQIIATGSEDTDIMLSSYFRNQFKAIYTLRKHNTGIQHLQWSSDGRYLYSSGGFEEFFVWKITPDLPDLHVGVVCESSHPDSGHSDLRITTFHAKTSSSDPESFDIIMLYSDSTIKCWQYTTSNRQWRLLTQGNYLAACPTQCVSHEPDLGFITANTDGHLTRWDAASDHAMNWCSRQPIHQNAILSLTTHPLPNNGLLVFSGGDDNAMAITRYCADPSLPAAILSIPHAHAAAITGLVVVADKENNEVVWVVSASIDQRVKLWRVVFDANQPGMQGVAVQRCANVPTSVADVSGLARIRLGEGEGDPEGVLVAGVGMDVWRLESLSMPA